MVECEYGDEGSIALLMCSQNVATQLAAFHASGNLGRLHRPRDLLRLIARPDCRDGMALWVMSHPELADPEVCNAFLTSPLEYALGLKQLPAPDQRSPMQGMDLGLSRRTLTWAAVAGLIGLLVWRWQRKLSSELPA
jgi:hypothetical protein